METGGLARCWQHRTADAAGACHESTAPQSLEVGRCVPQQTARSGMLHGSNYSAEVHQENHLNTSSREDEGAKEGLEDGIAEGSEGNTS